MASDIKNLSKSFLPGAGRDRDGNPSQRKCRVTGRIEVTSYARGGENLTPSDVKLDTIDYLAFEVENAVTGNNPGQGTRKAYYADAAQQFYVTRTRIAGGESEVAAASTCVLKFVAEGDAADAPELR